MIVPVKEEVFEYKGYYIHRVQFADGRAYCELGEKPTDFDEYYGLKRFRTIWHARSFICDLIKKQKKQAEADHLRENAETADDVTARAEDAFSAGDDTGSDDTESDDTESEDTESEDTESEDTESEDAHK